MARGLPSAEHIKGEGPASQGQIASRLPLNSSQSLSSPTLLYRGFPRVLRRSLSVKPCEELLDGVET
jgi:hypothetical protein